MIPILFVGQAPNSKKSEDAIRKRPSLTLTGSSGKRLASACGVGYMEWLRRSERVNLLDFYPGGAFPKRPARDSAERLVDTFAGKGVVFLGKTVASCFPFGPMRILRWYSFGLFSASVVPHPSGLNRWWNDHSNAAAARAFLAGSFL